MINWTQFDRSAWTAPNNGLGRPTGFTLVELLVVVVVLTILLALLSQAGQYVRGQGQTRFTRDLLARVQSAVEQYQAQTGQYPPDVFQRGWLTPQGPHRPRTEGIECLVWTLRQVQDEPLWTQPWFARALVNTDGDVSRIDTEPLYELVDAWGTPLLYYNGHGAESQSRQQGRPLPQFGGWKESEMSQFNKSLTDRWLHNERRPLINSAGPDRVFNNSDDL